MVTDECMLPRITTEPQAQRAAIDAPSTGERDWLDVALVPGFVIEVRGWHLVVVVVAALVMRTFICKRCLPCQPCRPHAAHDDETNDGDQNQGSDQPHGNGPDWS